MVGRVGAAVVLPILRIKNKIKFRRLLIERYNTSIFTSMMMYGSRYYHESSLLDFTGTYMRTSWWLISWKNEKFCGRSAKSFCRWSILQKIQKIKYFYFRGYFYYVCVTFYNYTVRRAKTFCVQLVVCTWTGVLRSFFLTDCLVFN